MRNIFFGKVIALNFFALRILVLFGLLNLVRSGFTQVLSENKKPLYTICKEDNTLSRPELINFVQNEIVPYLELQPQIGISAEQNTDSNYGLALFNNNFDFHSSVNSMWAALSIKRLLPEVVFTSQFDNYLRKGISRKLLHEIKSSLPEFFDKDREDIANYDFAWLMIFVAELVKHAPAYHLPKSDINNLLGEIINITLEKAFFRIHGDQEIVFFTKSNMRLEKNQRFLKKLLMTQVGAYADPLWTLIGLKEILSVYNPDHLSSKQKSRIETLFKNAQSYFPDISKYKESEFYPEDISFSSSLIAQIIEDYRFPEADSVAGQMAFEGAVKLLSQVIYSVNSYIDSTPTFSSHPYGIYSSTSWYHAIRWRRFQEPCASVIKPIFDIFNISFLFGSKPTPEEIITLNSGLAKLKSFQGQNGLQTVEARQAYQDAREKFLREGKDYFKLEIRGAVYHYIPQYFWRSFYLMLEKGL